MAHGDLAFWSVNVPDVPAANRFFAALFGWTYSDPGPSGAVVIEGRRAAMHDSEYRDPPTLWLYAEDLAAVIGPMRAAGGRADDIFETPQGLRSNLVDPWGAEIALTSHRNEPAVIRARVRGHGELMEWTVQSREPARSAQLFGELFGWSLGPDEPGGFIAGELPVPGALRPAAEPAGPSLWFEVDDLARAGARIDELGGSWAAVDAETGRRAVAADDQGYRFGICQDG